MQRWQRRAVMVSAALLLCWLAGMLMMLASRLFSPNELLSLHTLGDPDFGELLLEPIDDGLGGLVLQERSGRITRISTEGRLDWQFAAPAHFTLSSVQAGDGLMVLTGRYGRAISSDAEGSESWRYEPVHNEMHTRVRRGNEAQATFFTMATALVYGLDANGKKLWVRRIPNATSILASRPWMEVDSEGNLQTVSNGGRVRVSRDGQMELVGGGNIWDVSGIELAESGMVLERGRSTSLSRLDGKLVASQLGQLSSYSAGPSRYCWLTEDGIARFRDDKYARYSVDGTETRSTELSELYLLDGTAIQDDQLLMYAGRAQYPLLAGLPGMLSGMMRGELPDFEFAYVSSSSAGTLQLQLETAALSVPVNVPVWLELHCDRIYGFGEDKLLLVSDDGPDRICRLGGAR